MAIVRELLIRVGLVGDKKKAAQVEKSIQGFAKRATIAIGAITYAFQRVVSSFSDFANRILDTNEFSQHIGLAIEDLYALQKAATKVARIEEKEFQSALGNIQKMYFDLRTGASQELDLIAYYLKFSLDRTQDDATTIFLKILNGLSKIKDESARSNIAKNIFKGLDFSKFSALAGDMEKLAEETKNFSKSGIEISKSIDGLKEYEQSVRSLKDTWDEFVLAAAKDIVPALTDILNAVKSFTPAISPLIKSLSAIKDFWVGFSDFLKGGFTGDWKDTESGVKKMHSSLINLDKSLSETAEAIFGPHKRDLRRHPALDYLFDGRGRLIKHGSTTMSTPSVTISNEINVPPGTTESQAQFMSERIGQVVQEAINQTFMQIQHENPLVE